jgi:CheY-like chemotaxis protein
MDGYTASRTIRQDKSFDDLPIIAMTANAMAGDREKALEAGMNDHVPKPIDPPALFASLATWIKPGVRGFTPSAAPAPAAAEDRAAELPEAIAGLDLASGLNRVGGNRKLYRGLLLKLRDDYAQSVDELAGHLEAGRLEDAQRLAHTIKGVAGNVGAGELQAAAAAVEAAIKHGHPETCPPLLEELGAVLGRVVEALGVLGAAVVAQPRPAAGPESSPAERAAALSELAAALKTRKPKPSKEAFEKLSRLGWPSEYSMELTDLGKLVGKYKFMEALAMVDNIRSKQEG